MLIHHIAVKEDWERRDTHYSPPSLASDGFVHCSEMRQLAGVARALFAGRDDLFLLDIDPDAVDAPVRWEDLYDIGEEFPHVYGPIPVESVTAIRPFSADAIDESG